MWGRSSRAGPARGADKIEMPTGVLRLWRQLSPRDVSRSTGVRSDTGRSSVWCRCTFPDFLLNFAVATFAARPGERLIDFHHLSPLDAASVLRPRLRPRLSSDFRWERHVLRK